MVNATVIDHIGHLAVKFNDRKSRLQYVRENKRLVLLLLLRTAVHKVKRNIERSYVRVVAIVNERTPSHTLYHLESHGNRFERSHTLCNHLRL